MIRFWERSLSTLHDSLLREVSHPTFPDEPLVWGTMLLPSWAYDHTAASSPKSGNENYVVGPAIPLAVNHVCTMLAIYLINPVVAYFIMSCPEGDEMAKYPFWLVPLWVIMLLYPLKLEIQVLKYPIVPHLRRCSAFKIFGYSVRFSVWFTLAIMMSVMGHSSFVTNGVFLAKAWKTDNCYAPAADRWKKNMTQSVWGGIPLIGTASLSTLALIVWMTTFLQLLYVIGISYPVSPDHKSEKPLNYEVQFEEGACQKYDTLLVAQQHHGPALQGLAEFSRMATVTFNHWTYRTAKSWHCRSALKEIPRLVMKFLAFYCLASGPQLAIQVSTVNAATTDHSISYDYQSAASVFINLMMALKALYTETAVIWRLWCRAERDMNQSTFTAAQFGGLFETIDGAKCSMRSWVAFFALLVLCFMSCIIASFAWAIISIGLCVFAVVVPLLAVFAYIGGSIIVGYNESVHRERNVNWKVRMVNWKVGMQRPSEAEAVCVVSDDASASVVFICEMEKPRDAAKSAAHIAVAAGAPYKILHEFQEEYKKYVVTVSVLVRKGPDAECIVKVGEPQGFCRSPVRPHKACWAQTVRLGPEGSAVLHLVGANMDPHDEEFHAQLDQMDMWLNGMTGVEGALFVGDFNCRLACPPWASLESAEGEEQILTEAAAETICSKLASAHGRREMAQLDPLSPFFAGRSRSRQALRLRDMLKFDPLDEQSDPGFPTYKRTPGKVPGSDSHNLMQVFFGMPPEKRQIASPQRYVNGNLGGGVEELQMGWLDRAAWRLLPSSRLIINVLSHTGMCKPALSDHAATVTVFQVKMSMEDGV